MEMGRKHRARATSCRRAAEKGFTLTEILVTSAVIVVFGATAIYALTMINKYAAKTRIQAAAQAIVQHQIDQILTRGPYVPTNTPPNIPAILTAGTTVTNNVPVFTDPETGNVLVTGTLSTDIQDSGASCNGTPLYVLKAAVTLSYTFVGMPATVVLDTLRAPDQ
jgi:prepilin-type N-terminal cleavage/methylation domain-containing protein